MRLNRFIVLSHSILKYKTKRDIIFYIFLITIGFIIGWFTRRYISTNSYSFSHNNITKSFYSSNITSNDIFTGKAVQTISHQQNDEVLFNEMFKSQLIFKQTIRNCLGSNCFDEKVNNIARIGILSPLNSGSIALEKLINIISSKSNDISIIYDTHVPAYGYGKNHGWTRIIRLVRDIIPHSHSLTTTNSKYFDIQLRQLIRWHCRLSHVAAHTKMLSISINDLINQPIVEIEKILTFIGEKVNRNDITSLLPRFENELYNELGLIKFNVSCDYGYIKKLNTEYYKVSKEVIDNELSISSNLTKWPCLSFRKLDPGIHLVMSSNVVAANCTDKFVTCSVKYDQDGG